jgi:hypothetical protein
VNGVPVRVSYHEPDHVDTPLFANSDVVVNGVSDRVSYHEPDHADPSSLASLKIHSIGFVHWR